MSRERILVAMSGGVDSSVAAAILRDAGHDVVGVTLHLWDYPDDGSVRGRCCAPEDIHDARRVAEHLGIPHYAFDRREVFRARVVDPFVEDYLSGVTPSPCVRCNRSVKTRELMALADRLEASRVATGHYARIDRSGPTPRLLRAKDLSKDQSYFLHTARTAELARFCFPLGELTKGHVRDRAVALGLPGAHKGESQELCFVPTGRYDAFVAREAPTRIRPGVLVDGRGRAVGAHEGVHQFTVGQRRQLGVALGYRAYVTGIDAPSRTVTLGPREALASAGAELAEVVLAEDVTLPISCEVVVRYRGRAHAARVVAQPGGARIHFATTLDAVVPGQVAVFYEGDRVLGGGTVVRAIPDATGTHRELAEASP
jgi:tRNA-uridine 2-sulfurtransferase